MSEKPEAPYAAMKDKIYLPEDNLTLDGTFGNDTDGKPFMIYCCDWLRNLDGTMEKIELKPDLCDSIDEGKLMFKASDSPWSSEKDKNGNIVPNKSNRRTLFVPNRNRTIRNDMDQLDL